MNVDDVLDALAALTGRSPNSAQRAVMEYNGGPLWVIAGPGTGKTYALILRCLRLLCVDHVPPEAIVLTTFTRKAAAELRQRLQEALLHLRAAFPHEAEIDLSQMRLGTLHSLCWDFLTQTPGNTFGHYQMLNALDRAFFVYGQSRFCHTRQADEQDESDEPEEQDDQNEGERFLELVSWIENKQYRVLPPRWERAGMFIRMYERLLNNQIDRTLFAESDPRFALLIQLVEEYESALRQHSFTDQTRIQQQALDMLRSSSGKFLLQGIQHVIVDEYQDTNPLQAAIYRALADSPLHHLCVVGDDDQALYRFRSATVDCMVRFDAECRLAWPDCQVHQVALTETYRSHPKVVRWINHYITAHHQMALPNARIHDKPPLHPQASPHPDASTVFALRGKNRQEVARALVEVLQHWRMQGMIENYASCALLARSLKPDTDASMYIRALEEHNIKVATLSSPVRHLVYQQILGTLLLALDRYGNHIPPTFGQRTKRLGPYLEECRKSSEDNPHLAMAAFQIHRWLVSDEEAAQKMRLTSLAQRILNLEPCIAAIQQDPDAEQAAQLLIQTLDSYDRIVEHGWPMVWEEQPQGTKRVAKWWMRRVYYTLVAGIQQDQFSRDEDPPAPPALDAIQALTVHKAKGLEFPIVIVVVDSRSECKPDETHRLEQDLFPFRQDIDGAMDPTFFLGGDEAARAVQDLVRFHYVAYSRAQQVLIFLTPDGLFQEPVAIGLGTDGTKPQEYLAVWPPLPKKKYAKGAARGLW